MALVQVIAILLALTALFSYVNHRYVGLHTSVGIMLIALLLSLGLILLGDVGPRDWSFGVRRFADDLLRHVDFNEALLHWMLCFLLFAGALRVDVGELSRQRGAVALLATAGTVASMFMVGGLTWLALAAVGLPLPWTACLLFGALISPTDPVAVLALMKTVHAPKAIETKIAGEALFNDGVGVVLFLTVLGLIRGNAGGGPLPVAWLLLRQTAGGAGVGFLAGWITYQLIRRVNNYQVEVLLTLALALGGYVLAEAVGTSAPIAVVVAGLLIGNHGRLFGMSPQTRDHLDTFWELIEEVLNAVLFLLVGLEVLVTPFTGRHLLAGLLVIPAVLLARWLSVAGSIGLLTRRRQFRRFTIPILTWGGLRGGLSVAMALSIPPGPHRETIIAVTYGMVVFSILVQGTTIKRLVNHYVARGTINEHPGTGAAAELPPEVHSPQ